MCSAHYNDITRAYALAMMGAMPLLTIFFVGLILVSGSGAGSGGTGIVWMLFMFNTLEFVDGG